MIFKRLLIIALTSFGVLGAKAQDANVAAAAVLGQYLRNSFEGLQQAGLALDREQFMANVVNVFFGETIDGMTPEAAEAFIRQQITPAPQRSPQRTVDEAAENAWVVSMQSLPRAEVLASGVVLQRIVEGSGELCAPHSTVDVKYVGRLSDGTEFDRTEEPFALPLDRIVPGLAEAMLKMRRGGTYRVIIPPSRGYGAEAVMDLIPANSALDFTIEL